MLCSELHRLGRALESSDIHGSRESQFVVGGAWGVLPHLLHSHSWFFYMECPHEAVILACVWEAISLQSRFTQCAGSGSDNSQWRVVSTRGTTFVGELSWGQKDGQLLHSARVASSQ